MACTPNQLKYAINMVQPKNGQNVLFTILTPKCKKCLLFEAYSEIPENYTNYKVPNSNIINTVPLPKLVIRPFILWIFQKGQIMPFIWAKIYIFHGAYSKIAYVCHICGTYPNISMLPTKKWVKYAIYIMPYKKGQNVPLL